MNEHEYSFESTTYQDSVNTLFSFRLKEKLRIECENNDINDKKKGEKGSGI